ARPADHREVPRGAEDSDLQSAQGSLLSAPVPGALDVAMRLALTGRHVDITPGLRRLVDRKLARLDRILGNALVSAQVKLTLDKTGHCADVTVHVRGDHILRGRAAGATWTAALSGSVEKIENQATHMKGKWDARSRRKPPATPADGEAATSGAPAR